MGSLDNQSPGSAQNNEFVRPDMFRAVSLTEEETKVMKQLRYESAWKRGYPFAFAAGAVTSVLTRRFTMVPRIALTAVSAIIGNITGRISYLPTIHQRLLTDLPPDSPLRQRLQQFKEKGPQAFAQLQEQAHDDHSVQFDTGSSHDDPIPETQPLMKPPQEGATTPKKYITYEELRQKNRQGGQKYPVAPSSDGTQQNDLEVTELPTVLENGPLKRKRYNKYGDEIME